jgi:SAM-dependent methyltransferase
VKSTLLPAFDGNLSVADLTPREGLRAGPSATRIAEALQLRRDPGDWEFDRFMPASLAVISERFWTPLAVATRVAAWFDDFDIQTVVDIGSGAGKFCIATALAGGCTFVGIEQRPRLVRAARHLARLFRVDDRVHFLHGAFGDEAPPFAEAYYMYNPFGENLFPLAEHLDEDVELGGDRYSRDVTTVEVFLARARVGTFVVTYNEFGGAAPRSYEELRVANDLPNVLRLLRKVR